MKFIPMGDGVLIAPIHPPKEIVSPGGLITKIKVSEPPTSGEVIVTGESIAYVKPGDLVRFGIHAGREIEIDGIMYRLIKEPNLDGFFLT